MFRIFAFLVSSLLFAPALFAEPFWGSRASQAVDIALHKLKPGQFIWKGNAVPVGPMQAKISISEQKIYVYRNGILIGISTISTGKGRRSTPTGIFTVLGKSRYYRSRKYNNAPMPYTHWLTSNGIAMHAGKLPGYRASHGCIRLPTKFARLLFESSFVGMQVVITHQQIAALESTQASAALPSASKEAQPIKTASLSPSEQFRWQPEAAKDGSISIVMSKTDQRILVYRNGVEIGRAKLSLTQPEKTLGTHAYIMEKGTGINPFLKNAPSQQWVGVELPGYTDKEGTILNSSLLEDLSIPIDFAKALNSILTPGTTLLITDASILEPQITGVAQNTANNDKQPQDSKPQNTFLKPDESQTIATLDVEMEKLQAKLAGIKKDLANIEKRRLK